MKKYFDDCKAHLNVFVRPAEKLSRAIRLAIVSSLLQVTSSEGEDSDKYWNLSLNFQPANK